MARGVLRPEFDESSFVGARVESLVFTENSALPALLGQEVGGAVLSQDRRRLSLLLNYAPPLRDGSSTSAPWRCNHSSASRRLVKTSIG